MPGCGASRVERSPTPDCLPSGRAAGAHYPLGVGAGVAGVGTRHQPHSARFCELALCAVGAARGRPAGAPPAWVWGTRGRALSQAPPPVLSGMRPGPASHWPWVRCAGVGARLSLAPFPVLQFVVCCARFPGSRHPVAVVAWHLSSCRSCGRRRASLACLVAPRWCATPRPVRSLSVLRSAFLSPWCLPPPRGAVAPGFTWWLREACVGRLRTGLIVPAAAPCRGKGAGRAPRRTRSAPRDGVVPGGSLRLRSWAACAAVVWRVWTRSLTRPFSCTIRLATGDSAGAQGLFRVDADTAPFGSEDATPRSCACVRVRALLGRVGWAGLLGALCCASPSLWPFLVRSLLVRPPSGSGSPVCGCCWVFLFFFCFSSPSPLRCAPVVSCFARFPVLGALNLGVLSPSLFFFPPPPLCAPLSPALRVFGLGCPGPWDLVAPPPLFFFCPPPLPVVSGGSCFPVALGLCAPPPLFFSFFFPFIFCRLCGAGRVCVSWAVGCASVVLSLSLLCVRWLVLCGVGCWAGLSSAVSWWVLVSCFGGAVLVWPRDSPPCGSAWCVLVFSCPVFCSVARCCRVVVCCRALLFVCVVACACCLFLAAARLLCVFWVVVLCVPCPARSFCCARRLCRFWWLVLLFPGVIALCLGSAGGSGCPALSFGGVCRLWCQCLVWLSLGVFPVVSCSPVLCPVALCCRVVLCCGALSSFFVFLPAGGTGFLLFPVGSGLWAGSRSFLFLCSACAVLCWCACVFALFSVLSCPRGAGWCFVLLPVVFVCLLMGLAVLCCLLVGPGGSWCRVSVACCGVSLVAVLRRVAAGCAAWRCVVVHCVVSFCSVWCCRALCCVLGRCPSSWSPVPSGAVFCLVPPRCVCFAVVCCPVVLFAVVLCAVCALGCRVVRFLSSPPCAVLLCGPLSLAALCCALSCCAAAWCRGVLSCRLVWFVPCVGVVVPT